MQENLEPTDLPDDLETLTDEERFLFRKIGLSMKPYLLLGENDNCNFEFNGFMGNIQTFGFLLFKGGEGFMMAP